MTPPLTAPGDWRRRAIWGAIAVNVAFVFLLPVLDRFGFDGVRVERNGETLLFCLSPLWLVSLSIPVGFMVICAVAGLTLPSRESRFTGGIFLLFAVGIAIVAYPIVWTNELIVRTDGFSYTRGGWWALERQSVQFADLASIVVRRKSDGESVLKCRRRDGTIIAIPKSTVLQAGLPEILLRAAGAKVPVDLQTGEGQ